jgi:chromosomal replication initiator protein
MAEAVVDIPLPAAIGGCPGVKEKAPGAGDTPGHFLAGPENRLVQVAVRAVLEERPNGYNPIVLYGPSGTGKSHLALGLAAEWKARNRRRVECISAVDFARELAEAIEMQALEEFRIKYRRAGLLVFEDIGRLIHRTSEKLSAQDDFLHTLDALIDGCAWVIVTSASAPNTMSGLLTALQSRLTAGLTVPLALPESDAKLAIINRLAESKKLNLPGSVARTLAVGFSGTVAELKGIITQLEVIARSAGCRIDDKKVRSLLAGRGSERKPSIHEIALATARHFGLKLSELRSPSRQRAAVNARDAAVYLARNMIKCSFDEIGRYFGGRDHTTMMHGWHKIENLINTDRTMRLDVDKIEQAVRNV